MRIVFYVLFVWLTIPILCQPIAHETTVEDQLREELVNLKEILFHAHPQPFRFYSADHFDQKLQATQTTLNDSTSPLAYFRLVSSIMSMVGEGHSNIEVSSDLKEQIQANAKILPFAVHFYQGRAFIKSDSSSAKQNLTGHEITAINGRNISEIVEGIDTLSCLGVGHNLSLIYRKLSLLNNFAIAYHLFIDEAPSFDLDLLDTDGTPMTVHVEGKPIDFDFRFPRELPEADFPLTLNIDTARSLAVIKITTFAHWAVALNFKEYLTFYKKAFKAIKKIGIQHLVIDVRNNRGGQEYFGAQLLTYFLKKPFYLEYSMYSKHISYPLLDSLDISYNMIGNKNFVPIDSGYLVKESIVLKLQKPVKKYEFDGEVYFLTNGNCFSACNIFISLADYHKVGTIIGEETGGNYQDTDGYFRVAFELPTSGIKVNFPLWHIKTAVSRELYGRGVMPKIEVQPTIEEVLQGKDAMMEKVHQLIEDN